MTAAVQTACSLCGLDCGRHAIARRFDGDDLAFCCSGCVNVYAILRESGLTGDLRDTDLFRQSLALGIVSRPEGEAAPSVIPPNAERREAMFQVSGMWCSSCAWLIETALRQEHGIVSAEVFFASDLLKITYCPQYLPPDRILAKIARLGYRASEYAPDSDGADGERHDLLLRIGVAAFLWLNVMTFSLVLYVGYFERIGDSVRRGLPYILMVLATPAIFYSARPILHITWTGLRNRTIRMETLLALGILTAYGYSVEQVFTGGLHFYFDTACAIVTLVLAGKVAERGAKEKTARAIKLLYRMMPRKARLVVDGRERFVAIEALLPGAVFLVKAGERIAADGVVVEGSSHADESLLTGEPAPVAKTTGDEVTGGSINAGGVLQVRAMRVGAESRLGGIVRTVEAALSSRSSVERAVDRWSRVFVPGIMAVALLTFGGWFLATHSPATALMRAIAVLVIACPCALGIATPLALTTAIGAASRRGILVGDSRVLETIRKVDTVVFDKTGTVTEGDFRVLAVSGDTTRLDLVASLEAYSEHPLGRAVVRWAEQRLLPAANVEVLKGMGIRGVVDGHEVFAGNARMCGGTFVSEGHTVAFFGWDGEVRGTLVFGDRVKADAARVVAALKQRGIRTLLVSGDGHEAVERVAWEVGVDEFRAETLPERKLEIVRELQAKGAVVAMIGDGVNDAASLAQADLGIAMGSGADIAMEAAPMVLMNPALSPVLDAFALAERTLRIVRQNLFWAFAYNTAGIVLAMAGVLNPIMAAGAMVVSSLSVIGNSLRLQKLGR